MPKFNDSLNHIIESIPDQNFALTYATLLTEVLLQVQKIQEYSQNMKVTITKSKTQIRIGRLLLLCTQLEEINTTLSKIRHEYNL